MKKRLFLLVAFSFILSFLNLIALAEKSENTAKINSSEIKLPAPKTDSEVSIEKAINTRRSIRSLNGDTLTLNDLSQILWAAQGVTAKQGNYNLRTAPSAGATYPLEVYAIIGDVKDLKAGLYKYLPADHKIKLIKQGDFRKELSEASYKQPWVQIAPINILFTAVYERTTKKYGERAKMYVHMEAGHASQNIYLQCVSLDFGTVAVGAFKEKEIRQILDIPANETPIYMMPVAKKKAQK